MTRHPFTLRSRSKYQNIRTQKDGITFDSAREARRYRDLTLMLRAGSISELKLQPEFPFILDGVTIFVYRADFAYKIKGQADVVIEDAKGARTPVYKLKKRLIEARFGIKINEV